MASGMGCKTIILCCFMGMVMAVEVDMSSEWKTGVGWEVTCDWSFSSGDRLQSIKLHHNDQQFIDYKPQGDIELVNRNHTLPGKVMNMKCMTSIDNGQRGKCLLTFIPTRPPSDFRLGCEISGERPKFMIKRKDLEIHSFVPVSQTSISKVREAENKVTLNCTSSGMPAPKLIWTVDKKNVQSESNDSSWNYTSKLFDSWSSYTFERTEQQHPVSCEPETMLNGYPIPSGQAVIYNSCTSNGPGKHVAVFLAFLAWLRL